MEQAKELSGEWLSDVQKKRPYLKNMGGFITFLKFKTS